jgi:protein TonB
MPVSDRDERVSGPLISLFLHGLLIFILVYASRTPQPELIFDNFPTGAGGLDLPAGGGGGGTLGTGGRPTRPERSLFIQVAPTPPAAVAPTEVKKEVEKPKPTPEIKPPEVKVPEITLPVPVVEVKTVAIATMGTIDSTLRGRGGGTGNDGTTGSGPGRGGGVGSGIGTGRGSGVGPGTGGGAGNLYTPVPAFTPFLPPPPNKFRPLDVVAVFDVDATGTVLGVRFNRTGDRGYDREVEAALKSLRFRPAVDHAGRPVRASAQLTLSAK